MCTSSDRRTVPSGVALLLTACGVGGEACFAQRIIHAFEGEPSWEIGKRAAALGDTDGDGVPDYVLVNADHGRFRLRGIAVQVSGVDGSEIRVFRGQDYARLGYFVAGGRDLDGDSVGDLVFGAPGEDAGYGSVLVYSGATGMLILDVDGDGGGAFGHAGDVLDDVDLDGIPDLIAGSGLYPWGRNDGRVRVFSGSDGAVLHTYDGPPTHSSFGCRARDAGDLNADGVGDFMIGAAFDEGGSVTFYSGATGAELGKVFGENFCVCDDAGDVDGDGHDDVLLGEQQYDGEDGNWLPRKVGRVWLYSGATLQPIDSWIGWSRSDYLGNEVAGAGDVDGDGVPDLLMASMPSYHTESKFAYVYLVSGRTRQVLYTISNGGEWDLLGSALAGLGDLDGDGLSDFLVTAPWYGPEAQGAGIVYAGARTWLNATPKDPRPGERVTLDVATGAPGTTAYLHLVDVDGVAVNLRIGQGPFDSRGRFRFEVEVPMGFTGSTMEFIAYRDDPRHGPQQTARERVVFR